MPDAKFFKQERTVQVRGSADPRILTVAQLKQLKQLCHPDKHNNSPLSQKVWEFLSGYRARD